MTMPGRTAEFDGTHERNCFKRGRLTYLNLGVECYFDGTFNESNQFKEGTYFKAGASYTTKSVDANNKKL